MIPTIKASRAPASLSRKTTVAGAESKHRSRHATVTGTLVAVAATALLQGSPVEAAFRLPPISSDPNRCDRGFVGNTIGQANAVSDKVLDLRNCLYKGADLQKKVLSGALMSGADYTGANLQVRTSSTMAEAVLTKAYAVDANFSNADMTNAVIDRVDFTGANLRNVKFVNAVITGSEFTGTDLTGADFEDALIGNEDAKRLCASPLYQFQHLHDTCSPTLQERFGCS